MQNLFFVLHCQLSVSLRRNSSAMLPMSLKFELIVWN